MNILIAHNMYQQRGGEETVATSEMELLKAHGHNVIVYKRDNLEIDSFSKFRKMSMPFSMIFSIKTYREIKKIIRKEHIEIVHVHNTLPLISPSIFYAARKCKVLVVQTIHNFRMICANTWFYRDGHICEDCLKYGSRCALKHRCYRNSFVQTLGVVLLNKIHQHTGIYKYVHFICLTDFNKEKLLEVKCIEPNHVFVKPNFYKPAKEIKKVEDRPQYVLYAGRLDKSKGIHLMLKAWKHIDKYDLLVCGVGPEEQWCKEFIKNNSIKNVYMLGRKEKNELMPIMKSAEAVIIPTQWYEGFPMTIVESFSNMVPVIGSDIGNVNDIIKEKINGLHFKHDSVPDLVRAVNEIDSVDWVRNMTVSKEYGAESNYEILMAIYKKCIEQG